MNYPILLLLIFFGRGDWQPVDDGATLVSVRKIWDAAPHNAFTDLIVFKNRLYCVFREGEGHARGEGKIRVLASKDGETWRSTALLEEKGRDLRDAKLTITPDGRLMLNGGSANLLDEGSGASFYSIVSFSKDGEVWTPLQRIVHQNPDDNRFWLWRSVWRKGVAYGVAYMTELNSPATPRRFNAFVCRSRDGVHYERLTGLIAGGTEAALEFGRSDEMTIVLRGSSTQPKALMLRASPPYTQWTTLEMVADLGGDQIGGPDLLRLRSGQLIGAGRRFSDRPSSEIRTGLFSINEETARFKNLLLLPSSGDTSYPGLVWKNGILWMSYYSSHEGKSAIYLAKIALN
jgi:hypothetical protein